MVQVDVRIKSDGALNNILGEKISNIPPPPGPVLHLCTRQILKEEAILQFETAAKCSCICGVTVSVPLSFPMNRRTFSKAAVHKRLVFRIFSLG